MKKILSIFKFIRSVVRLITSSLRKNKNLKRIKNCFLYVYFIPQKTHNRWLNGLTARHLISPLKKKLKSGNLVDGIVFLKKKYPFYKPRSVKFLLDLYQYVQTPIVIFNDTPSRQTLLIHFCCWGKDYAEKARDYLLPSLLAEGNIPAISKQYDLKLMIHCDIATKKFIEEGAIFKCLQIHTKIHFLTLPNELLAHYHGTTNYMHRVFRRANSVNQGLKYLFLGALQAHIFQYALKQKALISFLIPDSVFSDSFLINSIQAIQDKKMVLSTTFRSDFFAVRDKLLSYCVDHRLSISGRDIARLQVEHLHNTDRRRTISPTTKHFIACARFIFKTSDGFLLRALHYHPLLMDCSKFSDIKVDYFPIDDAVLKQILNNDLPYEEQVWMCADTAAINWMELSGHDPEVNEPLVNDVTFSYPELIQAVYLLLKACPNDLNEAMNRFFIRNELCFDGGKQTNHPHEIVDSQQFLADMYSKLDGVTS